MPLKQPPFILSLLRLYCCSASSLTYSYIRPSTYNWNIKSSSHSTILLQQQQPFLPPPLSTQPLTSSSSSFHLKASFVYWGHYYWTHPCLQLPISGKIIPKWFFNVICSQTYVPLKWAQDWNIWTTSKRKNSVFSKTPLSFLYTYESDILHFLTLFST